MGFDEFKDDPQGFWARHKRKIGVAVAVVVALMALSALAG